MNIADISPNFLTMSNEEIEQRIRDIRKSRTMAKAVSVKARPTKTSEKKVSAVVDSLSEADKQALLKLFGGGA